MNLRNTWKAGIYIRLSKVDEDEEKNESESITNQRSFIISFLQENGFELYDEYIAFLSRLMHVNVMDTKNTYKARDTLKVTKLFLLKSNNLFLIIKYNTTGINKHIKLYILSIIVDNIVLQNSNTCPPLVIE